MNKTNNFSNFRSQMDRAGCSRNEAKRAVKEIESAPRYKTDESVLVLPSNTTDATTSATEIYRRLRKTQRYFKRATGNGFDLVRVLDADGVNRIQTITSDAFRTVVEQIGTLKKYRMMKGENGLYDAKCTFEDAKVILACQEIEQLDTLDSLRKYPIPALIDGRPQLLEKGYNRAMRLYITDDLPQLRTDLPMDEAVGRLEELLRDYKFPTPQDKARAFAALLTPALRIGGFIPKNQHVPLFAVEADQSQTGKSLFVRTVAAVFGEKCDIATQQNRGVTTLEESIANSIIQGASFLCIDNYRGEMDSQFLEGLLTAPTGVQSRVAYGKMTEISSRNTMFFITSNGMKTKGRDGANRMCMIQIRKREKDYPYREYEEGGLDAWANAQSSYFLSAVYSVIIKHFENGGNRSHSAGGHCFQYWAKLLNAVITETMGVKVEHIMNGHSEAQLRVGDEAIRLLHELARAAKDEDRLTVPLNTEDLVHLAANNNITLPSQRGTITPGQETQHIGRVLKPVFTGNGTQILEDGYTVVRRSKQETDNQGNKRDRNYYTFTHTVPHRSTPITIDI